MIGVARRLSRWPRLDPFVGTADATLDCGSRLSDCDRCPATARSVDDSGSDRGERDRAVSARSCDQPPADITRILMSTPGGRLRPLFRASIVLPVGCRMSISRLWVRISNCSRDLRSMCGTAQHRVPLDAGRQRDRPVDDRPRCRWAVSHDLVGGAVQHLVVVAFHPDADAFVGKAGHAAHLLTSTDIATRRNSEP